MMPDLACVRCGCTEEHACEGGCACIEISKDGALCSKCVPSIASILALADGFTRAGSKALEQASNLQEAGSDAALRNGFELAGHGIAWTVAAAQLKAQAALAARLAAVLNTPAYVMPELTAEELAALEMQPGRIVVAAPGDLPR